jgi:hypothetical protein
VYSARLTGKPALSADKKAAPRAALKVGLWAHLEFCWAVQFINNKN